MALFDEIAYDLCGYVVMFAEISIFLVIVDYHRNCIYQETTEKYLFSKRQINSSCGSSRFINLRSAAAYHRSK